MEIMKKTPKAILKLYYFSCMLCFVSESVN